MLGSSAECTRSDRAQHADASPERAVYQAQLERELLVPLKLYAADRDPVHRYIDLAPRAVAEPLVAMLPDGPIAHRCQHFLVDCDGARRIWVRAPELAEFLDAGGVRPGTRALVTGR